MFSTTFQAQLKIQARTSGLKQTEKYMMSLLIYKQTSYVHCN